MKRYKLFSVLALLVAVLFIGTVQQVDASIDTDEPTIVEVVSIDAPATINTIQEISPLEASPQYTAMEVCSFHKNVIGDKDHEIISLQVTENYAYGYSGNHLIMPRSNLSDFHFA